MAWDIPADAARCQVLDGGLATELERRGADLRDPLWSAVTLLERPDLVREVHRAYLEAGVDLLTTASYQATFQGLAARGVDARRAEALLRRSVALAREAWDGLVEDRAGSPDRAPPAIAASIGPYGAFLADGSEYRGDYGLTERELRAFHADRLAVLADSGADLLALETIPSRREAEALVELLERHGRARAWITFTGRDERHVADGSPFIECVASLQASERVVGVGINCTGPDQAAALLRSAAPVATKPFVVYPNSGERYQAGTGGWIGAQSGDWPARLVSAFLAAGARVIGGCCRTGPETVRAIRRALDHHREDSGG